jgi:alcohol dehydrogenase class IV
VTLPRETTAATGFDALTHAVEAAVSSLGNSLVRAMAATAIGLVLRHLPVAVESPEDMTAREGMLEAAFLGGICQSGASTGAAHALSHATSKVCGAAHGVGTAFYLLPTMRWNLSKSPAVYNELAASCRLADGAALLAAVADLAGRVGLAQSFAELLGRTPDAAERQSLAEAAAKDVCMRTNPCRLGAPELAQLVAELG